MGKFVVVGVVIGQVLQGVNCCLLHIAVNGGVNFKPAFIQRIGTEFINNKLVAVIKKSKKGILFYPAFRLHARQLFRLWLHRPGLGNIAVFYHLVKHKFLAFFAGFGVFQRVVVVRLLGMAASVAASARSMPSTCLPK